MHPVLFKIPLFGGVTIYTYGFMVALAFLAGIVWIYFEARRVGESPARATDLVFWIIIAAIVGSRIFYVIALEPARILKDPLSLIKLWEGGLVFYGGVIGAMLIAVWYIKKYHLSYWKYADIFAPAIPLGHVFGRIGCFMAGCCYGRPAPEAWWSITFPEIPKSFAPPNIPLYPTQLMEALGELLIFLGLVIFRKRKRFDGQVLSLYLIAYGVFRFLMEYYRGDMDRGFVVSGVISTSQLVSLILVLFAIIIWVRNRKKFPVEKKS